MKKDIKTCDLHTHSVFSDGTLSPCELVDKAIEVGISAIALTDHNTVDGLCEFENYAVERGIECTSGVEFSTAYEDTEFHVIGLFIDRERFDEVTDFIGKFKERKTESNLALLSSLAREGYFIDYEKLVANTPDGYINRAHIASEMVRLGYAESVRDAFSRFLSESAGYYKPPRCNGTFETIEFIEKIGAVSILAHPLLQVSGEELRALLPKAIEHGLCAIETQYSLYSDEETAFSHSLACEFGLLESGGSDFHGANKPDHFLGVGLGNLSIPYEFFEKLREKSLFLKRKV